MPDVNGYSLKEVAQKVGVVSATIVRWIDTNKINITKKKNVQGHYFFTEADLKRLIEHKNRLILVEKPINKRKPEKQSPQSSRVLKPQGIKPPRKK